MWLWLTQLVVEVLFSGRRDDDHISSVDGTRRLRKYEEHEVPRERQLIRSHECPACAGVGHAPCSPFQCRIECDHCEGTGRRACARCSGTGFAEQRVA